MTLKFHNTIFNVPKPKLTINTQTTTLISSSHQAEFQKWMCTLFVKKICCTTTVVQWRKLYKNRFTELDVATCSRTNYFTTLKCSYISTQTTVISISEVIAVNLHFFFYLCLCFSLDIQVLTNQHCQSRKLWWNELWCDFNKSETVFILAWT